MLGPGAALAPRAAPCQTAGDKAAAEAVFQQAQAHALANEKGSDEACARFELSQNLDAGIGTLLYLGDCCEQAARVASALATFKAAAAAAPSTPPGTTGSAPRLVTTATPRAAFVGIGSAW